MDNFVLFPPLSTFFLSTAAVEGSIRLSKEKEIRKEEEEKKKEKIVIILFVNFFRCKGGKYLRPSKPSKLISSSPRAFCVWLVLFNTTKSFIQPLHKTRREKEKKKIFFVLLKCRQTTGPKGRPSQAFKVLTGFYLFPE